MALSDKSKTKYLLKKGWYTFQSPNNWLNDKIMDDLSLDNGGLRLSEAFECQIKLETKTLNNG